MINVIRLLRLAVVGSFLLFIGACGTASSESASGTGDGLDRRQQGVEAESVYGSVAETVRSGWRSVPIKTPGRFELVYFLDERRGWACDRSFVYQTDDSGNSWKSYPLNFVQKMDISALHFTDELNGWLILNVFDRTNIAPENDQVKVYRTIDGGKTWKLSLSELSFSPGKSFFFGSQIWLTGRRFAENGGQDPQRLLHYSEDLSEWTDISGSLAAINRDPWFPESPSPQIAGFVATKDGCWVLANEVEIILRSCDKGATWAQIGSIGIKTNPIHGPAVLDVGIVGDKIWTFQSMRAIDQGIETVLTLIPAESGGKKKMLWLTGYFSRQAHILTEQEMFLSSERASFSSATVDPNSEKGIILHTQDGGATWNRIAGLRQAVKFSQFLPAGEPVLWLLSVSGDLYKVSRG